jgi:membrane protein implicated in regulation of membrane protease activity
MPIGAQPPGRRGTVGDPYSPLNLRLVLALFGLVVSAAFAVLLFRADLDPWGWLFVVLAVVAVIDLVVIQARRRARRRTDRGDHSLFE